MIECNSAVTWNSGPPGLNNQGGGLRSAFPERKAHRLCAYTPTARRKTCLTSRQGYHSRYKHGRKHRSGKEEAVWRQPAYPIVSYGHISRGTAEKIESARSDASFGSGHLRRTGRTGDAR
jgi:hypothetical protein